VSTDDQTADRQRERLQETDGERMFEQQRQGDMVVVTRLDRLAFCSLQPDLRSKDNQDRWQPCSRTR
jgi:hypothetical protein